MGISYYYAKLVKKLQTAAVRDSELDKHSHVCSGSNILSCRIGRYSYVGNFSTVAHCDIGSFCSISDHCVIGGASHPLEHVTTSPVMSGESNCLHTNFSDKRYTEYAHTVIDHDVWIGAGCYIKGGVHLSTGCVVGMGSVVTKDIGPYEIWAGNPAKLIRKRFDDGTIERLLNSQWWNMTEEELRQYAPYCSDPELFLSKVGS